MWFLLSMLGCALHGPPEQVSGQLRTDTALLPSPPGGWTVGALVVHDRDTVTALGHTKIEHDTRDVRIYAALATLDGAPRPEAVLDLPPPEEGHGEAWVRMQTLGRGPDARVFLASHAGLMALQLRGGTWIAEDIDDAPTFELAASEAPDGRPVVQWRTSTGLHTATMASATVEHRAPVPVPHERWLLGPAHGPDGLAALVWDEREDALFRVGPDVAMSPLARPEGLPMPSFGTPDACYCGDDASSACWQLAPDGRTWTSAPLCAGSIRVSAADDDIPWREPRLEVRGFGGGSWSGTRELDGRDPVVAPPPEFRRRWVAATYPDGHARLHLVDRAPGDAGTTTRRAEPHGPACVLEGHAPHWRGATVQAGDGTRWFSRTVYSGYQQCAVDAEGGWVVAELTPSIPPGNRGDEPVRTTVIEYHGTQDVLSDSHGVQYRQVRLFPSPHGIVRITDEGAVEIRPEVTVPLPEQDALRLEMYAPWASSSSVARRFPRVADPAHLVGLHDTLGAAVVLPEDPATAWFVHAGLRVVFPVQSEELGGVEVAEHIARLEGEGRRIDAAVVATDDSGLATVRLVRGNGRRWRSSTTAEVPGLLRVLDLDGRCVQVLQELGFGPQDAWWCWGPGRR